MNVLSGLRLWRYNDFKLIVRSDVYEMKDNIRQLQPFYVTNASRSNVRAENIDLIGQHGDETQWHLDAKSNRSS